MMDHTQSVSHIWFRWQDLESLWVDNILDLDLMLQWVKTGGLWDGWMYFVHGMDVSSGEPDDRLYWYCPLETHVQFQPQNVT